MKQDEVFADDGVAEAQDGSRPAVLSSGDVLMGSVGAGTSGVDTGRQSRRQ